MFHARRLTLTLPLPWINPLGWSTLFILLLSGLEARAEDAPPMKPYTVYVAQAKAHARCGPSPDYYRTDPLKHGQQLEVYAETQDGWLGVRPPADSFCWILADAVELDEQNDGDTGRVNEDRTVAWIGTHLGRARKYRWQVQLAEGELVSVLGRQERDGPDGPQLWFRIVPPSGEFRWIHRDQTVRTSEELVETLAAGRSAAAAPRVVSQPSGPIYVKDKREDQLVPAGSVTRRFTGGRGKNATAGAGAEAEYGNSVMVDELRPSRRDGVGSGLASLPASQPDATVPPSQEPTRNRFRSPQVSTSLQATSDSDKTRQSIAERREPLGSLAILGQPKIRDTATRISNDDHRRRGFDAAVGIAASDDGWVSGAARGTVALPLSLANAAPGSVTSASTLQSSLRDAATNRPSSDNQITQVSGIAPLPPQTLTPAIGSISFSNAAPLSLPLRAPKIVWEDQIQQVRQQVRDADVDTLRLVLSQLMSSQSSAAEVRVVAEAAESLADRTSDFSAAQAARTVATRAKQYASLADRRDGHSVVQRHRIETARSSVIGSVGNAPAALPLPPASSTLTQIHPGREATPLQTISDQASSDQASSNQASSNQVSLTGQLVQVYSARTHSPPFALTDGTGRTVAYVTPSPGINLRMHLNQQITVTGTRGFVSGLNTPHVTALRADR